MHRFLALALAAALLSWSAPGLATPGYFRFPAPLADGLVFTAEGDLWRVPISGGEARRITTHEGQETHAAVSPDGRQVAFVGTYAGDEDVYVMPLAGGEPRRLSFDAGRVQVHGWSPGGEVIYSSEDLTGPTLLRVIRLVDPVSRATRELPLHDANQAAFDDRGRVLFTRFGQHLNGDNARGYRGGALAQLWLFDPASGKEARRLGSDADGAMHTPMWHNGRWLFVSDRDGQDNLWTMDAEGGDARALTRHAGFEVRSARLHGGRIAYQLGADLRLLELSTGEDRALEVRLLSDFAGRRERWLEKPLAHLSSTRLSATDDRVALTVRGRISVAGPGPRRRVEIATPADSRSREAVPGHDGRWVYAINDASGRNEIWRFAADGRSESRQLTRDGEAHRWRLYPSPDGRWLAHTDKRGALHLLDLQQLQNRQIDRSEWGGDDAYRHVVWSDDGKTLAFVRVGSAAGRDQLFLHDVASRRTETLSSDRFESYAPAFSTDGRWLYFLSQRNFVASPGSPWGDRNTGPGFTRRAKLYALALQPGNRFPFAPEDELAAASQDKDAASADGKATPEDSSEQTDPKVWPAIALDGLAMRLHEVPAPAGDYEALAADGKRLYLLESVDQRQQLKTLDIGNQGSEPKLLADHVVQFELSADRKRLALVQRQGEGDPKLLVVEAGDSLPSDTAKATVRVADWRLAIDPVQEWKQMFSDAWRMHRDFSFDAGMRGLDWEAVRDRYAPLVDRLTDRAELDDLLAQMIGHLGILHSQVRGADFPQDREAPRAAMLGARFEQGADGLRIAHIYRSDPELPGERSPLARPGVDARAGDRLLRVNGRDIAHAGDLAAALHHQAGQQVLLELERQGRTLRTVAVPVDAGAHARLRYADWVQGRSAVVDKGGEGRIGYLHLRAMGPNDIASFVRDFYAQVDREGLIIDVRRNRGGNIDSWIIEKLLRRTWAFWQSPGRRPYWNMQQSFRGHLVVLVDPLTYSDGETFAAGVKALGIAPVIGTRTAGAGIWLSDRNRLADGGIARIAEFGQFGADGRWLIEGRGVSPDIEVDNLPHASWQGEDRQLDAAIQLLKDRLSTSPVEQPPAQPIPPVGEAGQDVQPPN
ncbi:S41 family peptidase [Pseudomarimonas salicorniae]|uniref:Tricorn protease homolog n=1 Tax=Pseudomarimonas salicorniae TaxID=2933270 RepID=A0ABT0GE35_9GAMM|nr:S41 family peptidase [Lysobacter sp. CAU 1642]MCK7592807.1 S41 family peptidase [Lysobacter sp. CAU 1642]